MQNPTVQLLMLITFQRFDAIFQLYLPVNIEKDEPLSVGIIIIIPVLWDKKTHLIPEGREYLWPSNQYFCKVMLEDRQDLFL
jgi:hypothetical protein